jgi:glycosyltransferase involved in cell wall biosynthesis
LHPEFHFDLEIIQFLKENTADITLVSETDIPTLRLAIEYLNWKKMPWALRGERPIFGDKGLFRTMLGILVRHRPLRTAKAIIANGTLNANIFRELSPWGKPIYSVPYYLDVDGYSFSRDQALGLLSEMTRHWLKGEEFLFMFVGALIPRKGVLFLIDAFNRVVGNSLNASLCVIGDGPLREKMKDRLTDKAMRRAYFLGNVDFRKIPSLLPAGDAFVFPTLHDGWGMAISEAMASGLPIISTNTCGAAYDLVQEGENGYILSPNDREGFVKHMIFLVTHPDRAQKMGQTSRCIIENHTPERGAECLYRTCVEIIDSIHR